MSGAGIFGEPETPPVQRLPERQLSDVTLTVYSATWNAERQVVRLHAEATTAFSDGTAGEGVLVGFFLNGRKLTELPTDDFGLALVEQEFPAEQFIAGQNTLVLRVKGFARQVTQTFNAEPPKPPAPPPPPPQPKPAPPPPPPVVKAPPVAEQLETAKRLIEQDRNYQQAIEVLERLDRLTVLQEMTQRQLLDQARGLLNETNRLAALLKQMGNQADRQALAFVVDAYRRLVPPDAELDAFAKSLPSVPAAPQERVLTNSMGMKLVWLPPGLYQKGDAPGVTTLIAKPFYIGMYPVTQAEYRQVTSQSPSNFKGDRRPVEKVSWNDAQAFCRNLSAKDGKTYRLPSEAEWEYACRAGTTTQFAFGDQLSTSQANVGGVGQTSDVGSYPANAWGLYDMHGNVWEWCEDSDDGNCRVLRGGSWNCVSTYAASAVRGRRTPDDRDGFGFRLVCEFA